MANVLGSRLWAIPDGFIPATSTGEGREMESHESASILNVNDAPADLKITIYFRDREPAGPYLVTVPARRTLHLRLNELKDPEEIPKGTDFASVYEASLPVIVQHTRLDSRQAANALLSTIAYSA